MIAGLLFVLIVAIEPLYEDPLELWSIKTLIPWLQKMSTENKDILSFVSWILDEGILFVSLMFFAFFNRASALYVLGSYSVINGLIVFMKMAYADGRPYMMDPSLDASRACSDTSFGNPSGHTSRALSLFVLQYLEFFNENSVKGVSHQLQEKAQAIPLRPGVYEQMQSSVLWKTIFMTLLVVVTSILALSRIVVAAHTLNQVMFGAMVGTALPLWWYYLT